MGALGVIRCIEIASFKAGIEQASIPFECRQILSRAVTKTCGGASSVERNGMEVRAREMGGDGIGSGAGRALSASGRLLGCIC